MQNKLLTFIREQNLVQPGDRIICAVSGGADSMALLGAMWNLKEKLDIQVEAAHFNHHLRGAESDRDEVFVLSFCRTHGIVCHIGGDQVEAGEKGLEAAAREARYCFLQSLPGKIATAHTADDNAETLLMHLIRGTGLKGLGGIAPKRENILRPMLTVTRREVLAFLEAEQIPYVTDSSNETDDYLRNRIRHHMMPLLYGENPGISENLSATALRLRQDEEILDTMTQLTTDIPSLRNLPAPLQTRVLGKLLVSFGVKEPEAEHIRLLRKVVHSANPSAYGVFPGEILVGRQYDTLVKLDVLPTLGEYLLTCPSETLIPELGLCVICRKPSESAEGMLLRAGETLLLRSRRAGDKLRLPGGTKTLKKLFIDKKIPVWERERIPVLADDDGLVAVMGIGPDCRCKENPNWEILFEML